MSAANSHSYFPLEGRNIHSVSRKEIIAAIDSSPQFTHALGAGVAARISSSVIVKYGRHVTLAEVQTMRFISGRTNIRIPTVIDAWEADDKNPWNETNTCYIVMEYIDGRLIADVWHELGINDRSPILRQLHSYIWQLQNIKINSPGPVGGGASNSFFFTSYGAGPFSSRTDIESWFNGRLHVCHHFGHAKKVPVDWFTGKFDTLVMCHLDIHTHNLIIDRHGILYLIDWGFAGAYPPYFELANLHCSSEDDFTRALLEEMKDTRYEEEVAVLGAITFSLTTGAQTKV